MANYDIPGVCRTRFNVESAFATDGTGTMANFFDLRHTDAEIVRATQQVPDETVVQRTWTQRPAILGATRCTYALSSYLVGTNDVLNAAATPTKSDQSKVLEVLLGGYYAAAGSTVEASPSPTTTGCTVATGHGSRFREGQIIGVTVSGAIYAVMVATISTDALTWWPALPSAPAGAAVVLNSQTIYPTDHPSGSLQVLYESAVNRGNIWLGLGMQGDLTLDLTRGQIAKWGSSLQGVRWLHDDEIATPQGGGAIAVATYGGNAPQQVSGSFFHFAAASTTTRTAIPVSDLKINLARQWIEIGDHSGVQGVGQWHIARSRPTIELTTPFVDETYHDAWVAGTAYRALYQLSTTAGDVKAIAFPRLLIQNVEPADAYGLKGQKLTCVLDENADAEDYSTEIRRAFCVLAFA